MARIPRSEATVDFKPTAQPFSTGDGYEAPGRGLQRIGQGIQSLGGAIASLQGMVDKEDEFATKLALLNASNEQDREDIERQQSFNIDRDDPDRWHTERSTAFEARAQNVLSTARTPRAQQMAALQIARMRGQVGERALRFAQGQKQQKLYFGAEAAITGEIGKLDAPVPELPEEPPAAAPAPAATSEPGTEASPAEAAAAAAGRSDAEGAAQHAPLSLEERRTQLQAERLRLVIESTERIIGDMPATPAQKQQLAKHATAQLIAHLGKRGENWPQAEALMRRLQEAGVQPASAMATAPAPAGGLGTVSAKYESGGRGVSFISSGRGDPGGASYGIHQLSGVYSMGAFLRSKEGAPYVSQFRGTKPMTAEFNAIYRRIAGEDPQGFAAAQKAFYTRTHYEPLREHAEKLGFDVNDRGVQEALFSASVQHAGAKLIVSRAARAGARSPQEQIQALYASRTRYVQGVDLPPATKASVLNRYRSEVNDALRLAGTSAREAAPTATVEAPAQVPAGGPVQVAQAQTGIGSDAGGEAAPDARPMNTIPGSATQQVAGTQARSGGMSPVRAELLEALQKAAPAMRERYMKQLEGGVAAIEEQAAKGYEVPDQMIDRLAGEVARSGNTGLMTRMQMTGQIIRNARATNQANPDELTQVVQRMEADALRTPPTPQQLADIEHLKKKRTEITNALGHNPYELGTKNGLLPGAVPPILPTMPGDQLAQSMAARAQYRAALHARYHPNVPLGESSLPFFQNAEKEAFTAFLKRGGKDAIAALGLMHDAWGRSMPAAMAEISKDAPDVATLGWLVSQNGDPSAIKAAADGLTLRATHGFKSRIPEGQTDTAVRAVLPAFQGNTRAAGMAVEVAKLIYETKAAEKALDPKQLDTTLWEESLQQAMGRNKMGETTYGGIGRVNAGWLSGGTPVWVPPTVKTEGGMTEIMSKLRMTDLALMPEVQRAQPDMDAPGLTQTDGATPPGLRAGMPVDARGRPVAIAEIRTATPVWVTGSRYVLRKADGTYLKAAGMGDANFVLDLEALRPVIEPRVAKGTFRPSDAPPSLRDILQQYRTTPAAPATGETPSGRRGSLDRRLLREPTP